MRFEVPPVDPETARHTPERGFIVTGIKLALAHPDGTVVPLEPGRCFPDTYSLETTTTRAVPKPKPSDTPAADVGGLVATADGVANARSSAEDAAARKKVVVPAKKQKARSLVANAGAGGERPPPAPGAAQPANATARPAPQDLRDVTLDFHFAANPTLNRPRWIVAALPAPIVAPAGAELRVTLIHGRQITSKPATVRRLVNMTALTVVDCTQRQSQLL